MMILNGPVLRSSCLKRIHNGIRFMETREMLFPSNPTAFTATAVTIHGRGLNRAASISSVMSATTSVGSAFASLLLVYRSLSSNVDLPGRRILWCDRSLHWKSIVVTHPATKRVWVVLRSLSTFRPWKHLSRASQPCGMADQPSIPSRAMMTPVWGSRFCKTQNGSNGEVVDCESLYPVAWEYWQVLEVSIDCMMRGVG